MAKDPVRNTKEQQDLGAIESISYNDAAGAKKWIEIEPVVKEAVAAAASVAATAILDLTADITLTSIALGAGRNNNTLTLEVAAPAANPTDTILADITGTGDAIIITITPNDGTNNAVTPVDLTTAELRELIDTGTVGAKTVTITDPSGLLDDQSAAGGDATDLADSGEGDGVVATFSGGSSNAGATVGAGKYVKVTGTAYTLDLLGRAYDSSKEYGKGDIVSHITSIYKANEDMITGAFDVSKWTKVADKTIGPVTIVAGAVVCTGRWHNSVTEAGFLVDDKSDIKHVRTRD